MASYHRLNMTDNATLAPASGFPLHLGTLTESEARGVIRRSASSVTATVYADKQCDVHVALLCAPLLVGASDSELLLQVDALSVMAQAQDIAISVPASLAGTSVAQTGTITITGGSQTVAGGGTSFPLDGSWNGYELQVKNGTWYQIASVQSATSLTLNTSTGLIAAGAGAFYVRRPAPAALIYRIWTDNVQGGTVETIKRDSGIANISGQPQIPGGLNISNIVVA